MRCLCRRFAFLLVPLSLAAPAAGATSLESLFDTSADAWTQVRAAALADPALMADAKDVSTSLEPTSGPASTSLSKG